MWCKYLDREGKYKAWLACEAYPNGVPEEIATGYDGHLVSRGDDGGIVFEAYDTDTWRGPFKEVGGD